MKKIIVILLLCFYPVQANEGSSTREKLLVQLSKLSAWCLENNERPAASVLLSLMGALHARQDTLMLIYTQEFTKQMLKIIEKEKNESGQQRSY